MYRCEHLNLLKITQLGPKETKMGELQKPPKLKKENPTKTHWLAQVCSLSRAHYQCTNLSAGSAKHIFLREKS